MTLSPRRDPKAYEVLSGLGVQMHFAPLARNGFSPLGDAYYCYRTWSKIRELRPHAVLAYTHKPCVYSMMAAAAAGVPSRCALITGLGYPFMPRPGLTHALLRFVTRCLYQLSAGATTAFVFQNPDDMSYFRELGIVRLDHQVVLTGGSGVPLGDFSPTPLPASNRFLMLSRLLVSKGVPLYLAAARQFKQRSLSAEFVLAGPRDASPDAISLQSAIELESGTSVRYLGKIDDVRSEISAASMVILPSSYREGVPRSLLEALASGRPIITTDMPGCKETLYEKVLVRGDAWERRPNGYQIQNGSLAGLVGAIENFIQLPSAERIAMGAASRRLACEKFDVEEVNRKIERVLLCLCA